MYQFALEFKYTLTFALAFLVWPVVQTTQEFLQLDTEMALVVMLITGFDFVLGFWHAFRTRSIRSSKMGAGAVKLAVYGVLILVFTLASKNLLLSWITAPLYAFLIARELISLIEKAHLLGVKLPAWIVNRLQIFQDTGTVPPADTPPTPPTTNLVLLFPVTCSLLAVAGCHRGPITQLIASSDSTATRVNVRDSVAISWISRDSVVIIKGGVVFDTVQVSGLDSLPIGTVVVREDSATGLQLRYWRNSYGQLMAECRSKDHFAITRYESLEQRLNSTRDSLYAARSADTSHTVEECDEGANPWAMLGIGALVGALLALFIPKLIRTLA